jgi:hypothetical protein
MQERFISVPSNPEGKLLELVARIPALESPGCSLFCGLPKKEGGKGSLFRSGFFPDRHVATRHTPRLIDRHNNRNNRLQSCRTVI